MISRTTGASSTTPRVPIGQACRISRMLGTDHQANERLTPHAIDWIEGAVVVGLIPIFWFPFRQPLLTLGTLPLLPVLWLARLKIRRHLSEPEIQPLLLYVLLATSVAAIPVFEGSLATPKILG